MLTRSRLVIAALTRQREANDETLQAKRRDGVASVQTLLNRFDIDRKELHFPDSHVRITVVNRQAINAGRERPVRFVGPNGERWAGCGKTPRWIREIEDMGGSRENYRIE